MKGGMGVNIAAIERGRCFRIRFPEFSFSGKATQFQSTGLIW
jgi:hypothetical protein